MPEAAIVSPASLNFEKSNLKRRELFKLDKADLDLGIYQVPHEDS